MQTLPPQDAAGNVTGTLTFGGNTVADAQKNLLYNNGSVFGATNWTWRGVGQLER